SKRISRRTIRDTRVALTRPRQKCPGMDCATLSGTLLTAHAASEPLSPSIQEARTMAKATLVRHELPPLPYTYDALEPHYDRETLQLHHDKHHKAYVEKLNHALEKHEDLASKEVEELLRDPDAIPRNIRSAVMNNAG